MKGGSEGLVWVCEISGMGSVELHKLLNWDHIAVRGHKLAPVLLRDLKFPVSRENNYNMLLCHGTACWTGTNLSATTDPFRFPERAVKVSDSCHTKGWAGPSYDMRCVWGETQTIKGCSEFTWQRSECVCWPKRSFLSSSHFLWIQSHSYHLFKLRVWSLIPAMWLLIRSSACPRWTITGCSSAKDDLSLFQGLWFD